MHLLLLRSSSNRSSRRSMMSWWASMRTTGTKLLLQKSSKHTTATSTHPQTPLPRLPLTTALNSRSSSSRRRQRNGFVRRLKPIKSIGHGPAETPPPSLKTTTRRPMASRSLNRRPKHQLKLTHPARRLLRSSASHLSPCPKSPKENRANLSPTTSTPSNQSVRCSTRRQS